MKKLNLRGMNSFWANALGMVLSIIIAFCFAIPFGIGYAIDWVTDLVLYTVIIEVSLDFVSKVREQKSRLCWEYYVGVIVILLADWCFMAGSKQTENAPWGIWMSITVFLAVGVGVWFNKAVVKGYARKLAKVEE